VIATNTGGIKEVVVHGETGYLVPIEHAKGGHSEPANPERFSRDLAQRVNELIGDPEKRIKMGRAGRLRAEKKFGWHAIAGQTVALYRSLTGNAS
jgi:starch synthase